MIPESSWVLSPGATLGDGRLMHQRHTTSDCKDRLRALSLPYTRSQAVQSTSVSRSDEAYVPSNPARMPTCFLANHPRSVQEPAIWELLPAGLRRDVLVWIDDLYFGCGDAVPRTVVWFVNKRTDRDLRVDLPVDETGIAYITLAL